MHSGYHSIILYCSKLFDDHIYLLIGVIFLDRQCHNVVLVDTGYISQHGQLMRQKSQTIIIFFLTLLLASFAPAGQLPESSCQRSITAAKAMPACCQSEAEAAEASMCPDSAIKDHACPQGGWCQVDGTSETYWRASGGLQPLDFAGRNLTFHVRPVDIAPTGMLVPRRSPPVRGGAPRYILTCSFLI